MSHTLRTLPGVVANLLDRARCEAQFEVCGLLGGRGGVITRAYPAKNVASKPATSYEIDPQEIVRSMREMRAAGLEFLGIYHSHPNGENVPSPRDIEMAYYSEEAYFILSPLPAAPQPVRAFAIREGLVTELKIDVL